MRQFLSDFITTLSARRRTRVGALLEEARVDKEQLDALAALLAERFGASAPVRLGRETPDGVILAGPVALNFRDVVVRLGDLYAVSDLISVLLASHADVLSSEVKALEDELVALEKLAANYAFLLSDGRAFDYAHLEPFSDETGRDRAPDFAVPDRAGLGFGSAEMAVVQADEGILVLPEQIRPHGLTGTLLKGNATAFMREETAFEHVYTPGSASGWSVVIRAPGPVTASLPESRGRTGAQVLLEFVLTQPAPASQIRLVPLANHPLELVRLTTYASEEESAGVELLAEGDVRTLERPHTVHFPLQTIARFRVLLNQPVYQRRTMVDNPVEDETRAMLEEVRRRRAAGRGSLTRNDRAVVERFRKHRLSHLVQLFEEEQDQLGDRMYRIAVPRGEGPLGVLHPEYVRRVLDRSPSRKPAWTESTATAAAFYRMAIRRIPELSKMLYRRTEGGQRVLYPAPGDTAELPAIPPPPPPPTPATSNEYWYHIGLARVAVGVEAPGFKGAYLSLPLGAPGDLGEVRIKTAERNHILASSARDSTTVTSVEYSVTNRSGPKNESDWMPILPVGTASVVAERFFPDSGGRGFLRFPADPLSTLHLYRNGYEVPLDPSLYISGNAGTVKGLVLPVGQYGLDDIFTVDYVPSGDPTTVSFGAAGFGTQVPLVAAHDAEGAGEGYAVTIGRHEVDLQHEPYVDPVQVASSTYSTAFGLTPYQPVVVRLSGGIVAVNLTNYRGGTQATLPPEGTDPTKYYYLHSGRTLIFNRHVTNLRVFYQYLQNSVRFRVVMRVNHKDFVSPAVDYVHLKAKTRRPDPTKVL